MKVGFIGLGKLGKLGKPMARHVAARKAADIWQSVEIHAFLKRQDIR
jgi:3-hydroxyisobutyrate dehydrogenase-like beta-hydroxyacid dehydrogenase